MFRDAGIAPLPAAKPVMLTGGADPVNSLAQLHLEHDRNMFDVLAEIGKITRQDMLAAQYVPRIAPARQPEGSQTSAREGTTVNWTVGENGCGFYAARGDSACAYTGHAEIFEKETEGRVVVTQPAFAAIAITALDRKPLSQSRRILVTACGRCENVDMGFSEDRRTVGRNWGKAPVRIEAVEGTLALPAGRWTCRALGPDGMTTGGVPVAGRGSQAVLSLSPRHKTMWYLLTRVTR
jgi:hypothetical protein